jgi:hypothetical protein
LRLSGRFKVSQSKLSSWVVVTNASLMSDVSI